jgi:hypothetical protein
MMQRLILPSVVLSFALVSASAEAALHRFTNVHGSSCQPQTPKTQSMIYSDTGAVISTASTPAPISLACPVPWSQDMSATQPLQKVVVTLDWSLAPVSGFSPSCMFYFILNNYSELWIPLTQINNSGTANPEYVFNSQISLAGTPLPAYGTVLGSALFCSNVPVGVGIYGYTIDTCFSTSLASC